MKYLLFTLFLATPLILTGCADDGYHHHHHHDRSRSDWNNGYHNHPPPRSMMR